MESESKKVTSLLKNLLFMGIVHRTFYISLSLTHTLSHTLTLSSTHTLSQANTHSHTHTLSSTNTSFLSLSSYTHTLSHFLLHTDIFCLINAHSLPLSNYLSLPFSLSSSHFTSFFLFLAFCFNIIHN